MPGEWIILKTVGAVQIAAALLRSEGNEESVGWRAQGRTFDV